MKTWNSESFSEFTNSEGDVLLSSELFPYVMEKWFQFLKLF